MAYNFPPNAILQNGLFESGGGIELLLVDGFKVLGFYG